MLKLPLIIIPAFLIASCNQGKFHLSRYYKKIEIQRPSSTGPYRHLRTYQFLYKELKPVLSHSDFNYILLSTGSHNMKEIKGQIIFYNDYKRARVSLFQVIGKEHYPFILGDYKVRNHKTNNQAELLTLSAKKCRTSPLPRVSDESR